MAGHRNGVAQASAAVSDVFNVAFRRLTGYEPLRWQHRLFGQLIEGKPPQVCALPTGLGKTSVIPIWLIALATAPCALPRRLIYVVNRRTVVDQATREAERIREKLADVPELRQKLKALCATETDCPLAISTLRGQFADNSEWRMDPARPAIIVGTVDMIGSRLLFSGYGRGFRSRPLHASFLGQDALLVHDEAHLEPAFQCLLERIVGEQNGRDFRPLRVMQMTATARPGDTSAGSSGDGYFALVDEDAKDKIVRQRLEAKKTIALHFLADAKKMVENVTDLAMAHAESNQAILVFLTRVDDVEKLAERLRKAKPNGVECLTGTLRGKERDDLVKTPVFQRFLSESNRDPKQSAAEGTVYLICTSAGEVGVDISADHLVCDLTTFESMAQRFGRVNRYGNGDAQIDIVHPDKFDDADKLDSRRHKTLSLLQKLHGNASPSALGKLPPEERQDAFAPPPTVPTISDILFDAWALTTIREPMPGRPPVADWLHGIQEWEPPETHVAWREEVDIITPEVRSQYNPRDLLDDYPPKPHELLRDRSSRVFRQLEKMLERRPATESGHRVWLIDEGGAVEIATLNEIIEAGEESIRNMTVILPPSAGGLRNGLLDGSSDSADDVADEWYDEQRRQRRLRAWDDQQPPDGMRLVRKIDTKPQSDEQAEVEAVAGEPAQLSRRFWNWYVWPASADDEGSKSAREAQGLDPHLAKAEIHAKAFATRLQLDKTEAAAVQFAAKWHDCGKARGVWQRSIGNNDYPAKALAKSGAKMRPIDLSNYRHELGSLVDVLFEIKPAEFAALTPESQDLALHLIAAHHGRARPHFPPDEIHDPERRQSEYSEAAAEVPRRFGRLQRKYGRWGLAYLESLVRAADILASGGGR